MTRREAEVIPITKRIDEPFKANMGMGVFLGSWGITFVGLFMAYVIVWSRNPVWPPPGTPSRPLLFPLANTVLALGSSVAFDLAVRAAKFNRAALVRRNLWITGVLGALFLVLQIIMWSQLRAHGFVFGVNQYIGLFYVLTTFHAAHVLVGLIVIGALIWRANIRDFTLMDHTSLRLSGWFWHFVTAAWLGVFVLLWVL